MPFFGQLHNISFSFQNFVHLFFTTVVMIGSKSPPIQRRGSRPPTPNIPVPRLNMSVTSPTAGSSPSSPFGQSKAEVSEERLTSAKNAFKNADTEGEGLYIDQIPGILVTLGYDEAVAREAVSFLVVDSSKVKEKQFMDFFVDLEKKRMGKMAAVLAASIPLTVSFLIHQPAKYMSYLHFAEKTYR